MTNLQAKVEGLTTTNALMKEDLSISRKSVDKIQAENRRLKNELEKFRKIEKKSESSQDIHKQGQPEEKRTSVVQVGLQTFMFLGIIWVINKILIFSLKISEIVFVNLPKTLQ